MKVKNLLIGLCMIGGAYTSAATAEVIQDCVLTGEVVSVSEHSDETLRVRFHELEHGDLAECTMKRRAKRGHASLGASWCIRQGRHALTHEIERAASHRSAH